MFAIVDDITPNRATVLLLADNASDILSAWDGGSTPSEAKILDLGDGEHREGERVHHTGEFVSPDDIR